MDFQTPPPTPAHVRLDEAQRKFQEAIHDPSTRKRLRQAAMRIAEEIDEEQAESIRKPSPEAGPPAP